MAEKEKYVVQELDSMINDFTEDFKKDPYGRLILNILIKERNKILEDEKKW